MTTIEIKDASGKKAGSADLAATVFGIEPNMTVKMCIRDRSSGAGGAPSRRMAGSLSVLYYIASSSPTAEEAPWPPCR